MPTEDQWETWHAFYWMRRRLDRTLDLQLQRDSDISAAEYEVLIALNRSPDRRQRSRDLALAIGWEKSRLSHQLSRMERRALVERVACETDARGLWIGLTTRGRRTVLAAMRGHTAALERFFFDQLDDDSARVLRAFSERVVTAMGHPADDELAASGADLTTAGLPFASRSDGR